MVSTCIAYIKSKVNLANKLQWSQLNYRKSKFYKTRNNKVNILHILEKISISIKGQNDNTNKIIENDIQYKEIK
jgi:hypothetical protein